MGRRTIFAGSALLGMAASPALAHHPLGGELPQTMAHGLLSGIGHPVIGLDHLAFVVAVGVAATLIGRPLLAPLAFVAATVGGTLLHLAAVGLPAVEAMIALSIIAIGMLIIGGRTLPVAAFLALFVVAGLFHGHAYGEAVFGAETSPVLAYLAGFGLTQWLVAVAAGALLGPGRLVARTLDPAAPRLAGAAVAGAGALVLSEQAVTAIGLG